MPGLSVAVVKDGEIVFAKGYGVRELGMEGDVDSETLFAIGSTTKGMTAAALGMMVDEGRLAWDDPVVDHLPRFQFGPCTQRSATSRYLYEGLPRFIHTRTYPGLRVYAKDRVLALRYLSVI